MQASTSQGYPPPGPQNAYPAYPTATPPQYPTHDISNQQLSQEAQGAATLPHDPPQEQLQEPSSGYKPRPLFCVVCASNQVSDASPRPIAPEQLPMRDSRIGRWRGILS